MSDDATAAGIYLASRSPRRVELLRQLGIAFEIVRLREAPGRRRDVVEKPRPGERPHDYVRRIALAKAAVAARSIRWRGLAPRPVLAADTEVVLDDHIFGKPRDPQQAIDMLAELSGRTHEVVTAIALSWANVQDLRLSTTRVTFRKLGRDEIERYVAAGESLDKAGAYAIQGRAAVFVRWIAGSYSGVMGLPLFEAAEALAKIGRRVL